MMAMEVSALTTVAFWAVSAMILGLAIIVVTQRDVFRAAIALAGSFMGVGILYFVLSAEFVGVVQILVYVGAISVLMAFAVMFIQDIAAGSRPSQGRVVGGVVALLVFTALAFTAYNTEWSSMDELPVEAQIALTEGYAEVGTGADVHVVSLDDLPEDVDIFVDVNAGALVDSTSALGVSLVRKYILAFEIIGLLLVASLIGGLLLMRDPPEGSEVNEPGPETGTGGASV